MLMPMTANSLQLASFVGLTASAGLVMVISGTQKKMLSWKTARRRCPVCGCSDRRNCSCRR